MGIKQVLDTVYAIYSWAPISSETDYHNITRKKGGFIDNRRDIINEINIKFLLDIG